MSSPKPPSPPKVNPYQGMDANPEFYKAQQELGISNANNPEEIALINKRMQENRVAGTSKDAYWYKAAAEVGGLRYYDKESYRNYANSQGHNNKQQQAFDKKMTDRYGTSDWYYRSEEFEPTGQQLDQINAKAYDLQMQEQTESQNQMLIQQGEDFAASQAQQQADMLEAQEKLVNKQIKAQERATRKANKQAQRQARQDAKVLAKRDAANQLAMEEAAKAQRQMMEDMMNQPVYMPKQGAPPVVQKPIPKQNPILPAPAAPSPMNIGAPPPPELTAASNKMAIVRTPKTTRQRQRLATRGTSSLIN